MKSPKAKRVGVAAAYKEFKKLNIHRFPINIFSIYKHYEIPLVSYTQALKQPQFYATIKNLRKRRLTPIVTTQDTLILYFMMMA